jgi:hypothetical protein
MNQVYIFQTELDYEGGVGPIVVVDAQPDLGYSMYSVIDALDILFQFDTGNDFADYNIPNFCVDDEYAAFQISV